MWHGRAKTKNISNLKGKRAAEGVSAAVRSDRRAKTKHVSNLSCKGTRTAAEGASAAMGSVGLRWGLRDVELLTWDPVKYSQDIKYRSLSDVQGSTRSRRLY